MVGFVKCFVCGIPAKSVCKACQKPVCVPHVYRHPACSEGK
jgi:hypothetical protein